MSNFLGRPEGFKNFGRTYSLKFFNDSNNLIHEIYSDHRNHWTGLRVNFQIQQQSSVNNQMAKIGIYNLSDKTKRLIMTATKIVLEAGYELNSGIIFKGRLVNTFDLREQPNYVFQLLCMDYQEQYSPIDITIDKGETPANIIKQVASQVHELEVQDKNLKNLPSDPYNKRIVISKMQYTAAFEKLSLLLGVSIWVTNGEVYALPHEVKTMPEGVPIIDVNYKTGMIGSPFFNAANTGVNCRTMLNHLIIPQHIVKIETLAPQLQIGMAKYIHFDQASISRGQWIILTSDHTGDSWEGQWETFFQAFSTSKPGGNLI